MLADSVRSLLRRTRLNVEILCQACVHSISVNWRVDGKLIRMTKQHSRPQRATHVGRHDRLC